ncbi:F0F1 ATP synthase subunit gamma [Blattabacterium cuenoti]|uniref:F0F1 ATP synthase subunit gamma n=1 Tax=Blattabacterium cuenoti TaxID=1653831 RepID=UPI00163D178E|nr:FoF1 ATP synthase subunit gamma [Blattabacterium cuenoti]
MSNIKEIKKKIFSINSVIKTTEAMKMISISKLRKFKDKFYHILDYMNYMEWIFIDLISKIEKNNIFFYDSKKNCINKKLFILFTSNKGLCGSFNSLIFNQIKELNIDINKKNYLFFSIGNKGRIFLKKKKYCIWNNNFSFEENPKQFIKKLIKDFLNKEFNSVYLIHHIFKKTFSQEIIFNKILPIPNKIIDSNQNKKQLKIQPILESTIKDILNYFIPLFLEVKFKKIFIESLSSENTSRMISMHQATDNAYSIKNNLILHYNKSRQNIITKEILEIISGLESIK